MRLFGVVMLGAAAATLTACGDVKEPNEKNFTAALQKFHDENGACLPFGPVPAEVQRSAFNIGSQSFKRYVQAGLADLDTQVRDENGRRVTVDVYTPSDKSKPYLKTLTERNGVEGQQICFGKVEVTEIDNWTEPSDTAGVMAARVTYKLKVTKEAPWTDDPAIAPLVRSAMARTTRGGGFDQEVKREDLLILTNKGWEMERRRF